MDSNDLYDWEIAEIGKIWNELQHDWMKKPNTTSNLTEFSRVAHESFLKAGFVVNVQWENSLIIDPKTMQPMPVMIEVLGRIAEPKDGYDYERKSHEVRKAVSRGEAYLGQKDGKVMK